MYISSDKADANSLFGKTDSDALSSNIAKLFSIQLTSFILPLAK
jgi:hypothetical protein